jgi:ribosomal protein L24E
MKPRELLNAIRDTSEVWVYVQATKDHGYYFQIGRKPAKRMWTELIGENHEMDFNAHLENGSQLIIGLLEEPPVKKRKRKSAA